MHDEEQLRELCLEHFDLTESQYAAELELDDLLTDPLDLLGFIVAAEDLFDVELDEDAVCACATLGQVTDVILDAVRRDQ